MFCGGPRSQLFILFTNLHFLLSKNQTFLRNANMPIIVYISSFELIRSWSPYMVLGAFLKWSISWSNWTCLKCEKWFSQKQKIKSHIASAHEGVTFSCTFCDRVFSMKTELNRHNKNVHTNKQQKPPTRTIMHF